MMLDFSGTLYDAETPYEVPFTANGESAVIAFVIRAEYGTGRAAPNPLFVYSDRIRVGLSDEACRAAEWGAGLADVGDVTAGGVACYIQFRREEGDGSDAVSLTDALGLVSSGFEEWPQGAHGVSVSLGTASGVSVVLAGAHGSSLSYGTAAGAQTAPASASGVSVSTGTASGSAGSSGPTPYYVLLESENIKSYTLSTTKQNNPNAYYSWSTPGNVDVRLGSGTWSATQSTSGAFGHKTFTRTAAGGETTVSFRNSGSGTVLTFTFPGGMSLATGQVVTFKLFLEDYEGELYLHSSDLVGQTYVEVE